VRLGCFQVQTTTPTAQYRIPQPQKVGSPITKFVDCSYLAYRKGDLIPEIPPTKFVDCLYLVYRKGDLIQEIPPTELVDCSYLVYRRRDWIPKNPTNEVGGLFIPGLQKARLDPEKSHQQSRGIRARSGRPFVALYE
jgi:hypothetical protein